MLFILFWNNTSVIPNNTSIIPKQNKFEKLVHLLGFTTEMYYDARPYEPQTNTQL